MDRTFHLNLPLFFFSLALFAGWWWFYCREHKKQPRALFSDLKGLGIDKPTLRERIADWPRKLKTFSLLLLLFALSDPHWRVEMELDSSAPPPDPKERSEEELFVPTRGIAAYLVLDRSGSMDQPVVGTTEDGQTIRTTRMHVLRKLTQQFIEGNPVLGLRGRPSDMLGLVAFARVPQILVPLTLDHRVLSDKLATLKTVETSERDGTAIGYAILKTANLIAATRRFARELKGEGRPAYEIESTIMILVTDGLPTVHPEDRGHPVRTQSLMTAAQFAKEQEIRVYIVNVEPALTDFRFAAQRSQLEKAAELTGGKFYLVDANQGLLDIYREIDQLEKSTLPGELLVHGTVEERVQGEEGKQYQRYPFAPQLIAAALALLLCATLLETTWLRRAP